MSGFAVACGRYDPQIARRVSGWARYDLPGTALANAHGLAGANDFRFMRTGSHEFRRVLNAGVSLTAAVALFSYASNLELSLGYVLIALFSATLLGPVLTDLRR